MKAKKKYGQNFLINNAIINNIVSLFSGTNDDLIIEIGPGKGALTEKLSKTGAQVLAIEIDKDMDKYLNKLVSKTVSVVYEDILNVDLESIYKNKQFSNIYIFGNLPYYITSPIIEKLINQKTKASKMYFMVQKEVAQRIVSSSGTKQYGYLTLLINFYYDSKICFNVPKTSFYPIPKVDSAFIELSLRKDIPDVNFNKYLDFLKIAFAHKRKLLKNNIQNYKWDEIMKILSNNGLSNSIRAEQIPEKVFVEIVNKLY